MALVAGACASRCRRRRGGAAAPWRRAGRRPPTRPASLLIAERRACASAATTCSCGCASRARCRSTQLDPARGRFVCVVLAPTCRRAGASASSRRAGRLRATLSPVDDAGRRRGPRASRAPRPRRSSTAPAHAARARGVAARAPRRGTCLAGARHAGATAARARPAPVRTPCTQVVPATGARRLRTRAPRRPGVRAHGRLRLLATGDSMIQIVDSLLKQRLERRRATSVRSDARISTGISKPTCSTGCARRASRRARCIPT